MVKLQYFKNFPRIIPIILVLGFVILIIALIGFSRQEQNNRIKQSKRVNEIVLKSKLSEISSLLAFSELISDDSSINSQRISSCNYDFLSFSIKEKKITITKKSNELNDQIISSFIGESLKDTILDSINLTVINFQDKSFLSLLRFKKISFNETSGILVIHHIPVDSIFINVTGNIENTSICGIKFNNTPILPQSIDNCLKNNLESNLLSINDHYEFECENGKRHYIGSNFDFNQSLRITAITPVENVRKIWWLLYAFGLIMLLIVFEPFFTSTNSIIAKQILEINNAVEALSSKDFDHTLSDNYEAELGILAKSINKLSTQFREIYRNLEVRVIRRTSEISMRNATLRKTQRDIIKQNLELSSAYDALKETREKYETLIQHLEEEYIFYSQSINGDLLFVSPSVTKILGFEVQEYRKLHDTLYSENPINIIARERSSNTKLGIAQPKFLKEIFDKEGKQKFLEVSEVPIYNEEGKLVSVEGLAHDISEKQKAEELIKEQEEKYRMLFTLASDIIFLYEIDKKNKKPGNIIEANNFMIEKLGYSLEDLRQKTPVDILAAEFSEEEKSINSEFLADDDKYERIWETKTGEAINVEISSHAFKIKDKNVVIAVARDITERKQVEDEIRFINEELYNQNENLEALVDNLTQTQEQLVQSEKMAALGQLIAGIAHEINTPLGAIKASIGNLSDSLEHALGELPSLFQNQSKENLVLFTMLFELSHRKSPELSSREKRQVKKDIYSILKENNFNDPETLADLMVYLEIYEISSELIENLKINNAMQVVRSARNFISLVKNSNTINLAVEKATKVVFALKKYAHRDTMGEKLPTDILDSIETVLTLYSNQLKQGIEVVRNYEKLPQVPCYQDEISQVWTNLIQNAIQAMNQEGKLTITAAIKDNMAMLSFKDTGTGITPDIKDKIFDPFFTTKKQGEGSGLGLDIVKKIIEKHDGLIYVESNLGEGANFIVKLPLE